MFNYLMIVNPTRSNFSLRLQDVDGSYLTFKLPAKGKNSRVPERFKAEIIDRYSNYGIVVQEQPISFLGELPNHPTRCYPGKAGDLGFKGSFAYYCIEDGEWVRHPDFPNQDEPVTCEPDTGESEVVVSDSSYVLHVLALESPDGERTIFTTPDRYVANSLVVYLNGIPYVEVDELSDRTFSVNDGEYIPDEDDTISVTYQLKE